MTTSISSERRLIELYSGDTDKNLSISLHKYRALLAFCTDAAQAYLQKQVELLDPVVGECACQIRAVFVANRIKYAFNPNGFQQMQSRCMAILTKVDTLLKGKLKTDYDTITLDSLQRKSTKLRDFFASYGELEAVFSDEEFFVIEAFLLSIAKQQQRARDNHSQDTASFDKLKRHLKNRVSPGDTKHHTNNFFKGVVLEAQRDLSKKSVVFVQQLARDIGHPSLLPLMEEATAKKDERGLLCQPMFWTYKALLAGMSRHDIPLVFKANLIQLNEILKKYTLYFRADSTCDLATQDPRFIPIDDLTPYLETIAVVIEGVIDLQSRDIKDFDADQWKKDMIARNVRVIYAGAAHHTQYPNNLSTEEVEVEDSDEYRRYVSQAEQEGMCNTNMSFFFIQHTYPERLQGLGTETESQE